MTLIVRIDDEVVGIDQFIKFLRLTGQLETILEQFVRETLRLIRD